MMLDRQLMFDDDEQVYGTQARGYAVKNPITDRLQQKFFIWSVKHAAGVNQRRALSGSGRGGRKRSYTATKEWLDNHRGTT